MENLWNTFVSFVAATWHALTVFLCSGTDASYLAWAGIVVIFIMFIPQLLMLREILAEVVATDGVTLIFLVLMVVVFPLLFVVGAGLVLIMLLSWVTGPSGSSQSKPR